MTQIATDIEVTTVTKKIEEQLHQKFRKEEFSITKCDILNEYANTYNITIHCKTLCTTSDIEYIQNIKGLHIVYIEPHNTQTIQCKGWYDTQQREIL